MRIHVRHEAATPANEDEAAQPERTCAWIVGDDGETIDTRYLAPGEETTFDVGVQLAEETTAAQPGGQGGAERPQSFPRGSGLSETAEARAGEEPAAASEEKPAS